MYDCIFIAEIHHSAILYIALSNLKIWIISMYLMNLLILEYHLGQILPPLEQFVC